MQVSNLVHSAPGSAQTGSRSESPRAADRPRRQDFGSAYDDTGGRRSPSDGAPARDAKGAHVPVGPGKPREEAGKAGSSEPDPTSGELTELDATTGVSGEVTVPIEQLETASGPRAAEGSEDAVVPKAAADTDAASLDAAVLARGEASSPGGPVAMREQTAAQSPKVAAPSAAPVTTADGPGQSAALTPPERTLQDVGSATAKAAPPTGAPLQAVAAPTAQTAQAAAVDRSQTETVTVRRVSAEAAEEQKHVLPRIDPAPSAPLGPSKASSPAPTQGAQPVIDGLHGEVFDIAANDVTSTERRATPDHVSRAESALRHDAPRPVMQQVAEAARALRDGPVEMTLQPEELGKVRLTLTAAADGSMTFAVQAERSETMDLLRRHIGDLARELQDLGFENLSFSFGQDRTASEHLQTRPRDAEEADSTIAAIPLAQTGFAARPGIPGSASGLDLRL